LLLGRAVHTLGSLHELWAARNHLQPLADRAESPFLGIDWIVSAAEAFHRHDELQVKLLACGGETVAVAPLVSLRRNGHESLELIGTSALMEPAGLLHDGYDALKALVRDLVRLGPPVHLRGIDLTGATMRALREVIEGERRGVVLTNDTHKCLTLPIELPWPEYVRSLSPQMHYDLGRLASQAAAIGHTRFEMLTPSPDDVPAVLAMLIAMEDSNGTRAEPSRETRRERLRAFYSALASRAATRGTLRVGVLHIGHEAGAMQLCLEAYQRLWLLRAADDPAFTHVSPGFLLMHQIIKYAHEQRLASVEFLGEAAPWQMRWQPVERTYTSALAVPLTARGLSNLALDAISRATRRWLPSPWGMQASPLGPEL